MTDLQQEIADLRRATLQIADAVERLTRLEERHASTATALERAFGAIGKLTERVVELERAAPVQAITTRWVLGGVWAVLGAVGAIVIQRVVGGGQ